MKQTSIILTLIVLTVALFVASLYSGSVVIPVSGVTDALRGIPQPNHPSWAYIVLQTRLPEAITALLCGASLSAAGLLLQTAFRNPLAGPSILGIDSGANLGVAVVMLLAGGMVKAGAITLSGFALIIAGAVMGAVCVMFLLLFLSTLLRNELMLLIAGVMMGYVSSSFISLLNYGASKENVHSFVMWGMGSFSAMSMDRLPWFVGSSLLGILMAVLLIKPLNALLLGDNYARNLGIGIRRTRTLLLLTTGLLTATCTAFCGPISFIGLAVPHIARMLLGCANHRLLLPTTLLCGAVLALTCNLICAWPGLATVIPVNVITPILGAPVVLYVILKRR